MSGGSLNYFYITLEEHSHDFDDKELNHLVEDLAELFHDREWLLSGDTSDGNWREAKIKFKEKWFTQQGRQERIEQYLKEFTEEIRETFGMNEEFCKDCVYWESNNDGYYGKCKAEKKPYLQHRYDRCEKFNKKAREI